MRKQAGGGNCLRAISHVVNKNLPHVFLSTLEKVCGRGEGNSPSLTLFSREFFHLPSAGFS
jgi:hypothetical protein